MNIMQLVEGKKYKDNMEGITWWIETKGMWNHDNIIDEEANDLSDVYESADIRRLVFTEVKEPLTITLEAEELELLKKAWISWELSIHNANAPTNITKKLNGIK